MISTTTNDILKLGKPDNFGEFDDNTMCFVLDHDVEYDHLYMCVVEVDGGARYTTLMYIKKKQETDTGESDSGVLFNSEADGPNFILIHFNERNDEVYFENNKIAIMNVDKKEVPYSIGHSFIYMYKVA